ncbi:Hypothetical protein BROD_1627 [Brucella sp. NF 2653]|nr:Hypothetical protein BROD_1627 [Brucella sp. NF 2653]
MNVKFSPLVETAFLFQSLPGSTGRNNNPFVFN